MIRRRGSQDEGGIASEPVKENLNRRKDRDVERMLVMGPLGRDILHVLSEIGLGSTDCISEEATRMTQTNGWVYDG